MHTPFKPLKSYSTPVVLVGGGEIAWEQLHLIRHHLYPIIGVDSGANALRLHDIIADVVIGDFDSTKISSKDRLGSWIETPDQNKTDLEKTFEWCISKNIKNITLLGAGGLREDHFLGNLYIVSKFYDNVNVKVITNHSKIICVRGSKTIKTKKKSGYIFYRFRIDK